MAQKAVKKDDDSETGYRFGAETGVRLQLAPWARLSITGSAERFTDVPTAVLPNFGVTAQRMSTSMISRTGGSVSA